MAVACVALIPTLIAAGGHPSALVRIAAGQPLAALVRAGDPGFSLVDPDARYAGGYAYAIARDPVALGQAHRLFDNAALHYAQPGYGWLAGLLSGGQARALPVALVAMNVVSFVIAAASVSMLSCALGRSGWWGALVFLNPGFIFGLTADTPEPLLIAAASVGLLLRVRRRSGAGPLLAGACFVTQAGLLAVAGLGLFQVATWVRAARARQNSGIPAAVGPGRWPSLAVLALGPALYALWCVYLLVRLGSSPLPWPRPPAFGLITALGQAGRMTFGSPLETHNASGLGPLLLVVAAVLVLAILRFWRLQGQFQTIAFVTAALTLALMTPQLLDSREFFRFFAVPVTFVMLGLLAGETPEVGPAASAAQTGPGPATHVGPLAIEPPRTAIDIQPSSARPMSILRLPLHVSPPVAGRGRAPSPRPRSTSEAILILPSTLMPFPFRPATSERVSNRPARPPLLSPPSPAAILAWDAPGQPLPGPAAGDGHGGAGPCRASKQPRRVAGVAGRGPPSARRARAPARRGGGGSA